MSHEIFYDEFSKSCVVLHFDNDGIEAGAEYYFRKAEALDSVKGLENVTVYTKNGVKQKRPSRVNG